MAGPMSPWLRGIVLALVVTVSGTGAAELVNVPLPDGTNLRAYWFTAAATSAPRPVVIALHGCGGLYERDGSTLGARYQEYVERFQKAGYHVVLPDSLGWRGVRSLCATPGAKRTVRIDTRRGDVLATLRWVVARPEVDPARIALLGWSNGATTTLATVNTAITARAAITAITAKTGAGSGALPALAAAVVLYPGCKDILRKPFVPGAPLLMLLGAKDDWTPPGPCLELAQATVARQPGAEFTVRVYADSVHGFDSTKPVRFWKNIPNGTDAGGVHVGGNPVARDAALAEIDAFLRRHLGK